VRSGLSIFHLSWVRSLGVGTALAVALWNLNKLRFGYTEQGIRFLEGERRAERKRIAQELHDTLLQGLQGVLLEFEVLLSRLPEKECERAAQIERKLRHIVVNGRNAVNALRSPDDDERDWMVAILEMGERSASDSKVKHQG
jgi:signal transduction histidine kinase